MRCWLIIYEENMWYSWSLSHNEETPISVIHKQTIYEIWGIDCNTFLESPKRIEENRIRTSRDNNYPKYYYNTFQSGRIALT